MRVQNALGWSLRDHLTPHPPQPTVAMFCAEMFHAVGPQGFSKPYRFSPGGRTGFGPAFTLWQFRRIKLAAINVLEDGLGLCALPGSCDDLRGFDDFGF